MGSGGASHGRHMKHTFTYDSYVRLSEIRVVQGCAFASESNGEMPKIRWLNATGLVTLKLRYISLSLGTHQLFHHCRGQQSL